MILFRRFEFPEEQQRRRRKAIRLAWLTIGLLAFTAVLMYLTLGQSEAMKTAWVEDLLGMIPPIALLIAARVERRDPDPRYPFGYLRAISVAFLASATVLFIVGLWLLLDAAMKLLKQERPPVGTMELFGHAVWTGWLMMGALAIAVVVGFTLGTLKRPVARELHDKVLAADADMNKADWMSEGAAIVGILLIGFGFWWGDSVAAAVISLNIIHDGWRNLKSVVGDLMDESPTEMGGRGLEKLPAQIRERAEAMPWVREAYVRLRELGHVLAGEVIVVPRDGTVPVETLDRASDELQRLDWRIGDLAMVATGRIEKGDGRRDATD